jgi:hypothetical protein
MNMKIFKYDKLLIFSSVILILSGSCKKNSGGSSIYTPTNADVTATATLQELQQGRTLYMNNCNACHSLYSPDDYTPIQWRSILPNMAPRTGMTSSEVLLVTKYITRGN